MVCIYYNIYVQIILFSNKLYSMASYRYVPTTFCIELKRNFVLRIMQSL